MMHFRHHGNGKMVPDVKIILRGDSVIKKEMIAMLLAGGQGSRLGVLTSKVAKPAVAFGGKYRIIDFPLSNCINSGVDTVGVLTQYQPLRLNTHIGIGIPWDLDRNVGGVTVLPPYEKSSKTEWYTGTANAIYQNLNYMETYNPEYVLILSGDHIYKMDYEVMLDFHKATNADVTIAVMPVPLEEASRFGIVVTDENNVITDFQEKPAEPKSNLASMGMDGSEILKEVRKKSNTPVIMVTARDSIHDQLLNFANGADDYITKPYALAIVKVHIEAILKRAGKQKERVEVGHIAVEPDTWRVYVDEKAIETTPKEYELLSYLIKNKNVVMTRDSILESVWGYDYSGDTRTVDTLVKQLRRKIAPYGSYIRSVYGVGYIFEGEENETAEA